MSDVAISVTGVSKMYKMFGTPKFEVMSLLGFPVPKRAYQTLWALRDINLEVARGGRIGIIGHNGAGKSTLLKIIAGQVTPTEGNVVVQGSVQALMELGTGFHPEFSGRENIFSSLSYQGLIGVDAESQFEEILAFSELEDFIDNPVKTYSAGMYARLAFSVATAINPEILIIDEVLGAGDAYFASKCVDRMQELTDSGATVLFVSHDMAAVQRLCDYAILIKRGRITTEGETLEVSKRYMQEVRVRDENRIRAANMRLRSRSASEIDSAPEREELIVRFVEDGWREPRGSLPVGKVALMGPGLDCVIAVGDAADNDTATPEHVITQIGYTDWSEPARVAGRWTRSFTNTSGRYHHAPLRFVVDAGLIEKAGKEATLCVEYFDRGTESVQVEVFVESQYVRVGTIEPTRTDSWCAVTWALPVAVGDTDEDDSRTEAMPPSKPQQASKPQQDVIDIIGDGRATIDRIYFRSAEGVEQHVFDVGDTVEVGLDYRVSEELSGMVIALAIYSADGITVYQDVFYPGDEALGPGAYEMIWSFSPGPFGVRDYVVSAALYRAFDSVGGPSERMAYCLWDRRARFQVTRPTPSVVDMGIISFEPRRMFAQHAMLE